VMQVKFDGFGRALHNTVRMDKMGPALVRAIPLG